MYVCTSMSAPRPRVRRLWETAGLDVARSVRSMCTHRRGPARTLGFIIYIYIYIYKSTSVSLVCVCVVRLHFFIREKLSKASARTGHMAVLAARCPTFPWAPPLLAGAQGPPAAALVNFFLFFLFFKNPKMPNFPLGAALVGGRAGAPSRCLGEKKNFFPQTPRDAQLSLGRRAPPLPCADSVWTLPWRAAPARPLKRAPARRLGGKKWGGGSHPCTDRTDAAMCGLNLSRS